MFPPFTRRVRPDAAIAPPGSNGHETTAAAEALPDRSRKAPPPQPEEPDYYAILGVLPDATQEKIAIAYRRSAASVYSRRIGGARSARNLKLLNAAYEVLGKVDRRREYDRRREDWLAAAGLDAFPAPKKKRRVVGPAPMDRPRSFVAHDGESGSGALLVLALIAVALVAAAFVVMSAIKDFSPLTHLAGDFGLVSPRPSLVAERPGDLQPLSATEPLQFATPSSRPTPVAQTTALPAGDTNPFAGSAASISNERPSVGSTIVVRLRLVRNGTPLPGVPVYAIAHFRTVPTLRWPSANGTVQTNRDGEANIEADIGDATRGYEVKVDAVATVDDIPHTWTTSFIPQ